MITSLLQCRLGNNMFQIAAAIGLAVKHDVPYAFQECPKPLHGGEFDYAWFINRLPRLTAVDALEIKTLYKEPCHEYREIPFIDKNMCLDGFFQSEKYFSHCREEILKVFDLPHHFKKGVVGIHVRRGDYLFYSDRLPTVTTKYIGDAMSVFKQAGYRKFKFFSDGIQWCKEKFEHGYPYTDSDSNFEFSQLNGSLQDLAAMAECEHLIMSNSSYSLWGYILNRNPYKQCVAPKAWFGKELAHLETKDIYPENCVIL